MKIGLYIEHGVGNGVGGAELMMAYLASVWSRNHDVDLVHHRPPLTRERISLFSSDNYDGVNFRYAPREEEPNTSANPLGRYRAARHWHRSLSAGYDLFVNCTHWFPPFCHAREGALLVLFPFYVRPPDMPEMRRLPLWKRLRHRAYYDFEWTRRLATYRHVFAISEFARVWTRRRWGIDASVIHPPVDIDFTSGPKDDLILSVGRFSTMAHTKKQMEMMRTFRDSRYDALRSWTYACVGGLNDREENRDYFERVREAGRGCSTLVQANPGRTDLRQLFSRAKVFWHATGLDDDTDVHPELAEHFGIATVEAMAAGAVPVVINKGGQPEIVRHGQNGFVWNTLDELKRYTHLLAEDRSLWNRMSAAARQRAQDFGRPRFIEQLSAACGVRYAADSRTEPLTRDIA
jgi:glycosyltransferase involved in cell wall biosynthesis